MNSKGKRMKCGLTLILAASLLVLSGVAFAADKVELTFQRMAAWARY